MSVQSRDYSITFSTIQNMKNNKCKNNLNLKTLVHINLSKKQWIRTIFYKNKFININIYLLNRLLVIINKYIFILKIIICVSIFYIFHAQ